MVADGWKLAHGEPYREDAASYADFHDRVVPVCGSLVWIQFVPVELWLATDAVGSVPVGGRFAGGRDLHDRSVADFSLGTEFGLSIRNDRFLYRRILFPGVGNGSYFAGALQPVSAPALFPDLCRPGFERKAFLL